MQWCSEQRQKSLFSSLISDKHLFFAGLGAATLPDNYERHPSSWSDQAEPSGPRCQTAEWTGSIRQVRPARTLKCADKAGAAPYLYVDAILKAALGLRLHQPATVLWRTRRRRALVSFSTSSCSFPLLQSWGHWLPVIIFACGLEALCLHALFEGLNVTIIWCF